MIIIALVVLIAIMAMIVAAAVQKRRFTLSQSNDSSSLEIQKDMELMMAEMRKLYEEKAFLADENQKLKQEIELLKKNK